jgi:hypothetical protein
MKRMRYLLYLLYVTPVLALVLAGMLLRHAPLAHASDTWTTTGSMSAGHFYHTATLLPNGNVLVAGGFDASTTPLASAELYDPNTGTWSVTGSMNVAASCTPRPCSRMARCSSLEATTM